MKRWTVALGSLVVLVGLASCTGLDAPAATKAKDSKDSKAVELTIVGGHGQANRGQSPSGEHVLEVLNPFPSDFGPVPQLRGEDLRPAVTKVPLAATVAPSGTLVLYDDTGPYGWLGELYGVATVNLARHFGATTNKPVAKYVSGELAAYKAVIYIGSTYDQKLPVAFLDDVLATKIPVIWMYDNIWQLANRSSNFYTKYGFNPWMFDTSSITRVTYKRRTLTRDPLNGGGIMRHSPLDSTRAVTVGEAVRADGTTLPWAVRASNLTYIGEIPFAYISSDDRYLAFCDLLFDALAPATAERHRALVRIEDVSPLEDPAELRAIVDYLYANSVPFSIAVIPLYLDPMGVYNNGVPQKVALHERPQMVSALRYAVSRKGTLLMHGYSHQFGNTYNPYSAVSADDFEFFASHIDAQNQVIYDGPVAGDSSAWALSRIDAGLKEMAASGLAAPTVFEYPHYAGSPTDSKAIRGRFTTAYHRGLYFGGALGHTPEDLKHSIGQFFPYSVTDTFGFKLKPENLGNYEPVAYNNHPPRLPADLIKTAQNNLVIRDGVASFFFHPYYDLAELKKIVAGVKAAGYTFVGLDSI
jgi:uncharacterized protein YdaL